MCSSTHLLEILQQFKVKSLDVKIETVQEGHIHSSYKILKYSPPNNGYFLQKINQTVFQDVEKLMTSIDLVTKHISHKLGNLTDTRFSNFKVIPTIDDKLFYKDAKNSYWRLYSLIPEAHSFQKMETPEIAYECGKIQGQFINLLSDFPIQKMYTAIPNFHNLEKRWEVFQFVLEKDLMNRAKFANDEIDFAFQKIDTILKLHHFINEGSVPKRLIHNDTKCNNVLFDKNNKAIAVVDLDTVMPGSLLFDFGDAIRTGANTASEDEKNIQKVTLDLKLFKSYSKGFLQSTAAILTQNEISHLVSATHYMTFIIGLRFLTDYLDGDRYYKTTYSEHNLIRTRVQWKFLQELEKNEKEMHKIIMSLR
ncbi:MAG: aminoglycoside phosphotransferase family protein [Flavobacteriaceae bacterium]|nr:aminoglycoside phosphotransferase family protein [Flavobacteriaceae bacterium]